MAIIKKKGRPRINKDEENNYRFAFVINKEVYKKFENIAQKEHRTAAMQLRLLIDNFVKDYEKQKL